MASKTVSNADERFSRVKCGSYFSEGSETEIPDQFSANRDTNLSRSDNKNVWTANRGLRVVSTSRGCVHAQPEACVALM